MTAYSFKRQFVTPIRTGTKAQTIRADRKRHVRPGEEMQLYTGIRTKDCFLIGRALCLTIEPIRLALGEVGSVTIGDQTRTGGSLDEFARLDGFEKWSDLVYFWKLNHPDTRVFRGVLIRWHPLGLVDTAAAPVVMG